MSGTAADTPFQEILGDVADYYDTLLAQYGNTAQGVDWNGDESQTLRFSQLSKLIRSGSYFSINDIGCGYGALFDFMASRPEDFSYFGSDISADMIAAAQTRLATKTNAHFLTGARPGQIADYGLASGIFNVRLQHDDDAWKAHLIATLDVIDESSRYGFAFNCLTSYSDPERMRDYLFYANPGEIFDLCKRRYSRQVALLHDYGLYEFTILVRKET